MTKQRLERPADGNRTSTTVDCIGQGQTDHGVDRPGMQPPVDEGLRHCQSGNLGLVTRPPWLRVRSRIRQWLANAVEDQADAHARGKEHGKPGEDAEFGLLIVTTESDLSEFREPDHDREDDESADDQHVVPAEVRDNPAVDAGEHLIGAVRQEHRQQCDRQNRDQRGPEDGRSDEPLAEAHTLCLQLRSDLIIGVGICQRHVVGQMQPDRFGRFDQQMRVVNIVFRRWCGRLSRPNVLPIVGVIHEAFRIVRT